jgi:hypothetical protein
VQCYYFAAASPDGPAPIMAILLANMRRDVEMEPILCEAQIGNIGKSNDTKPAQDQGGNRMGN